MKIIKTTKYSALVAMVLSVAVGCASAPMETDMAEAEPVVVDMTADAQAAIDAAKAANDAAKAAGAAWRDTDKMIADAEKALAEGDADTALGLANAARSQAENALAQKEAEDARLGMDGGMAMTADSYTVMSGDNLWNISGKGEIYGNPYHWPLIYKANSDQIKDADLIYPGQNLAIDRSATEADFAAAADHARNRGAWAIGEVEESDQAYLAR